jgi:cell division protein FtsB
MAGKVKATGFARFFIIMLFVAPLAYIGASYYNGQDGIENIKRLFTRGEVEHKEGEDSGTINLFGNTLRQQVEELKAENAELNERLREQEAEIEQLKREVRLLRR